ncbi:geranylgeranyl diphosphate synthase type II [Desulfitispora alkaliphila]|uniref:polyprenyl synthetase family protein n=1 Tax=Desulfitispora alkaliphila TaxID=622674 RepID=UPI003D1B0FB9
MNLDSYIAEKINLINDKLDKYLPDESEVPELIHQSMRYSVFAGGKRLRPILVIASSEAVGFNAEKVMPTACALELIHTYSLVHDDLPAMDDDDYRRGKLTNHKVYGEATAILTGDALLTKAFELIAFNATLGINEKNIIKVLGEISSAAGSQGMVGGQVVDMQSENKSIGFDTLKYIHTHKTGDLFKASVRAGAILANASDKQLAALTEYAEQLGLAFQITDDILDVEGDAQVIGKAVGSDQKNQKSTYPSLFGIDQSKEMAYNSVSKAINALDIFGSEADRLRKIANYLTKRKV